MFNKWKCKFKITNIFLIFFIFIFIFIIIVDIFLFGLFVVSITKIPNIDAENFTRQFVEYIDINNNNINVKEDGKIKLKENNAWIQVLNDRLEEVYSVYKPIKIPAKYDTFNLINSYKYQVEDNSIFIYKKNYFNKTYIYLIGFSSHNIAKHTMIINIPLYTHMIKKISILFIGDIFLIILLIYIFLYCKFASPINSIIEGVTNLTYGDYNKSYIEKGIYKDVFFNLNILSKTMNKKVIDRIEIEKIRNEWIYSISHDLKTPLSSIKGFAEILKNSDYKFTNNEIKEYSQIIWNKAIYLEALVNDLNLTNKLKNKLIPLRLKKINIVYFVSQIISQILNDKNYFRYNIEFYYSEKILYIEIDEILMKRAILNLIVNALKHNDPGVLVKVSIYKSNCINILIEDNGQGISKYDLNYVFDKYYRGTSTKSTPEGSGLGMAISKEIIELHNGEVSIESVVNKGTKLSISLFRF